MSIGKSTKLYEYFPTARLYFGKGSWKLPQRFSLTLRSGDGLGHATASVVHYVLRTITSYTVGIICNTKVCICICTCRYMYTRGLKNYNITARRWRRCSYLHIFTISSRFEPCCELLIFWALIYFINFISLRK